MIKDWTKKEIADLASTTLIRCIHHRRSPLFEEGMKKLVSVGFNRIWILESGTFSDRVSRWGGYQGPYERQINIGYNSFMTSMDEFWKIPLPEEIERIVMVDNDCFIFDPIDTLEYVCAFVEGQFDAVSLCNNNCPRSNDANDIIIPEDLSPQAGLSPGGIAYSIFRKSIWHQMNPKRDMTGIPPGNWWSALSKLNPKFGIHRMKDTEATSSEAPRKYLRKYRSSGEYSQFEVGRWLHIGNLIVPYYNVETGKEDKLCLLDRGYFCKYFPAEVHFSIEKCKQYIKIWDRFMEIMRGSII